MDELIYLDHAAATPCDETVQQAMRPYLGELFFNPSSPYRQAVEVRRDYEAAKTTIARIIGTKKDELIMTAGATESINLAFTVASSEDHVVTDNIEHHAVLEAAKKHNHTIVKASPKGIVSPEVIASAITPQTKLVSVALANNELGTIQPIKKIAAVVQAERQRRALNGEDVDIYFHVDGSQGAGLLDIHAPKLGVDLLTLNAGKLYGPKQVGLLWARSQAVLLPTFVGGGQEGGLRSGTENVAGVVGFAVAFEKAEKVRKSEVIRLAKLRDEMQRQLADNFEEMVVSGDRRHRLPGHLHVSFPGVDGERLVFRLESRGVLVATGSACAANKGTRSHVLTAIGLEPEVADGSLRISLGKLSNEENIQKAVDIMIQEIGAEYQRIKR